MPIDDEKNVRDLSLNESKALLDRDRTRLDIAETKLAHARTVYAAQVTNSAHADLPEVRERLEALHGSALREAEADAERLARAVSERARALMEATQTARAKLSAGETVEAGAFAPFAEAACRDLALGDLVSEIRGAVVADDRARMFAYSWFLPKRLAPATGDPGGYQRDPAAREKAELRRLLGVINERLADPDFAPVNRRAAELVSRAGSVARDAGTRAREAYRAANPYAFQGENDVKRWK